MNKWIYIGWGIAWISTSAAVCVAIVVTKSSLPLWAMFIPTFISISRKEDTNRKGG